MWRISIVCLSFFGATFSGCDVALAQFAEDAALQAVMAAPLQKSRTAIAECRERRLNKEIATYKDSAICSNPRIFTAWQEAKYPHMDLITAWLNAREVGSEKVDKGMITGAEFERQMAELTTRLTLEERRRRAGVANLGNEPQVPPTSSESYLVGLAALQTSEPLVATPPAAINPPAALTPNGRLAERARSAPKKMTVPRQQVASLESTRVPPRAQLARPVSTASAGLMPGAQPTGPFSPNDSRWDVPANFAPVGQSSTQAQQVQSNRNAPTAMGGPYVPVEAAPVSTARSARLQTADSLSIDESAGGAYVQVSSQRSESEAQTAFRSLQSEFPSVLGSRRAVIRRADLGGRGIYYRAQIGPFSAEQADRVCSNLRAAGGQCFIQYN